MTYERRDRFHTRAKAQGYRARSAYKLAELAERFRLLPAGARVVDLGCWPGGWLQVAAERIGPRGVAVGLDLATTEPLDLPNVHVLVGDVRDPGAIDALRARLGGAADVVLCDVAPKLTGVRAADEARQAELTAAALAALPRLLRTGGTLVMKRFMNPEHGVAQAALRAAFDTIRTTRPEATRRGSAELYTVAMGYQPSPPIQAAARTGCGKRGDS